MAEEEKPKKDITQKPETTESNDASKAAAGKPVVDTAASDGAQTVMLGESPKRGGKLGWLVAFVLLALLFVVGKNYKDFKSGVKSPEAILQEQALEEAKAHKEAVNKLNIAFAGYIKTLESIELSKLSVTEAFVKTQSGYASESWAYAGPGIETLQIPVVYKYFVDGRGKWSIDVNGNTCKVSAPELQVSTPQIPSPEELSVKTSEGWSLMTGEDAVAALTSIKPVLDYRAYQTLKDNEIIVRSNTNLSNSIKSWLLNNFKFENSEFASVVVSFAPSTKEPLVMPKVEEAAPATEEVAAVLPVASNAYQAVPGWGLDKEGKSLLGSTHGSIVIDGKGNVYVSADNGIHVFRPDGELLKQYLADHNRGIHDMEIRTEEGVEYIYAASLGGSYGVKLNAGNGKVVLKFTAPEELKLEDKLKPTAITVAGNGDVFLADGYGSNMIFKFDKEGNFIKQFGKKGNGLKEFNTAHGMTLDTRYTPNRLLICDRNHQPMGRLLHYDLEGEFIEVAAEKLYLPCSVAVQGDLVAVPSLNGVAYILDKQNSVVSVLGYNRNSALRSNYKVPQSDWREGVFNAAHGCYFDKNGNLYFQDWNKEGRLLKFVKAN